MGRLKVPFGRGSSHNEEGLEDMESHKDNENDMENTEASNESEDMRGHVMDMEKRLSLYVPLGKCPYDGFGIAQLKEMAREAQIDVSSCFDRSDIVGQLRDGGVKPKQAPKQLFGGARKGTSSNNKTKETAKKHESPKIDTQKRPAQYVAMEKSAFEGYSVVRLNEISREEGVDVSSCFERSEIVSKLKEAGITEPKGTFGLFGGGSPKRSPRGKAKQGGGSPKRSPRGEKKEVKTRNSYETRKRPSDPFDGCSISQLKELAAKSNVSIASCIDRSEIVTALKGAGVTNRKSFFGRR
jgi:hypothetical protein